MTTNDSSKVTQKYIDMKNFSIDLVNKKRTMRLKILQPIPKEVIYTKEKDLECLKNMVSERIDFFNYSKVGYGDNIHYLFNGLEIIDGYLTSFSMISTFLLFIKLKRKYSPKLLKPLAFTCLYFSFAFVIVSLNRTNFDYYYKKYLSEELLKNNDEKELFKFLDYKLKNQLL